MKQEIIDWLKEFRSELYTQMNDDSYRETFLFIGKMLLAGLIFRVVLFLDPNTMIFQVWLAEISRVSLNLFGFSFGREGILLISEGTNYLISRDCLGWKSMAAFSALVFASTDSLRDELEILVAGIAGLGAANVVRIVSTVLLSEAGIISFEIVHTFLWRWGMTLLVLLIWYLWLTDRFSPEFQGIFK